MSNQFHVQFYWGRKKIEKILIKIYRLTYFQYKNGIILTLKINYYTFASITIVEF